VKGMCLAPERKVVLIIVPVERASMWGSTAWMRAIGVRRLASRQAHQSVRKLEMCGKEARVWPEVMFRRMEMGPIVCSMYWMRRGGTVGSLRSTGMPWDGVLYRVLISEMRGCSCSAVRAVQTTIAPQDAKSSAEARPMPR